MATLQYTVFNTAAEVALGPVLNENVITIAASSAQSPTVMDSASTAGNKPRRVRIAVDANCYVTWGSDPTALSTGLGGRMMGSDTSPVEYFDIPADQKIAVISR